MRGHDRLCAGKHPVGCAGAAGRAGRLARLCDGGLSPEFNDRVHTVRRRCAEIPVAAPLEPAAPAAGVSRRAQDRARLVWFAQLPSIANGSLLSALCHHRPVLGAAWHGDDGSETGTAANSSGLMRYCHPERQV